MEPSPRGQSESIDSVRSKLRESLAASFALVSKEQNKFRDAENSSLIVSDAVALVPSSCHIPKRSSEDLTFNVHASDQKLKKGENPSSENPVNEKPNHVSPEGEVPSSNNFVVKDDNFEGNGVHRTCETTESHVFKRPKLVHEEDAGDERDLTAESPQTLATKIEAELFKLFGGVNKKYKEKGRSLLFNLKDRNNPELRERVMSGEIAPERLCSMTAEELASKELSEWRIAKAEELAQMVILPDSDVDIRRLVRKTHKGEFQVEVERDDGLSVEVEVGGSLLSQMPSKPEKTEASEEPFIVEKVDSGDRSLSSNQITHDGSDFMEEYMVQELTDSRFLPAIVSLDEFMGSLDSEPFEILPVDAELATPTSKEKGNPDNLGSQSGYLDFGSVDPIDSGLEKPDNVDVKYSRTDSNIKYQEIQAEPEASLKENIKEEASHATGASQVDHVWEGLLQLNVSALATVDAFYKSGEKTSMEDWANFLEIKGRVRVDAFEKFLQELHLSRTRAIMVVHFSWKEGSSEIGLSNLCEVAESYVKDERVGFAEPAPGVELYFCPPHLSTVDMLGKHMPSEYLDSLRTTDNGLIGVVIWRKSCVTSTISPKLHKQNSKKHLTSRRHQEKDSNPNADSSRPPPLPMDPPPIIPDPPVPIDEDDDVPPGFGPAATRDEDDLPEFDFVKGSKPPVLQLPDRSNPAPQPRPVNAPQPVNQMRELIHKYGQRGTGTVGFPPGPAANSNNWQQAPGTGVEIQDWNDEDDIPEWRPQLDGLAPPPPPPSQRAPPPRMLQQQLRPMVPQPLVPPIPLSVPAMMSQQPMLPQMGVMQGQLPLLPPWQPGTWWGPNLRINGPFDVAMPNGMFVPPGHFGGPIMNGQFYGRPGFGNGQDWRPDISRSRGI